jgi:predicted naringenin-chalcone synthase
MHGTDTDFLEIGEMKISVSVLYIKSDMTNANRYHLSTHEIMKKVIEKFRPTLEKEHAQIMMENNRILAQQYLDKNEEIKRRMLALPDDKISGEAPHMEKGNSEETSHKSQEKEEENKSQQQNKIVQEKLEELQAIITAYQ